MTVGLSRAQRDRSELGLHREILLKTDWQDYDLPFVAKENQAPARIHFDMGGSGTSIDISHVDLVQVR